MTARVDPETGGAFVVASEGTIEVTVGEASATLDEGEAISGDVDPEKEVATIVATEGDVPVTAQGETQTLTPGTGTTFHQEKCQQHQHQWHHLLNPIYHQIRRHRSLKPLLKRNHLLRIPNQQVRYKV